MSNGLNLNFGGVKAASGYAPIPEGTYDARIEEIEVKDTKEKDGVQQKTSDGKQAQYLNVKYKITEDGPAEGRFVWGINSIRFPDNPLDDTEKERQTREIFLSWLNTATGTDWGNTEENLSLSALVGSPVRLVITHRTYQGEVQNNVKKVMPPENDNGSISSLKSNVI